MRILIAPDKFAGTLTAVQAAEAIAAGWRRTAPGDELLLAPLADGGPGFVDVLHDALGGQLHAVSVTGPLGEQVPGSVLLVEDTGYVESAQACGLHLVPADRRDPETVTSYGVGELVAAAAEAGARRIVVGLGGSAGNDGGAGLLAALGAQPADQLRRGGIGLADLTGLDLAPARDRVAGLQLVAASDVDNPLLGLRGASNVFGPQKGASQDQVQRMDAALTRLADLADKKLAGAKGAGAAGGLGYGLLLLGAERVPGIQTVLDTVGLADLMAKADLVVTGEGCFDFQSLRGKVVSGVAALAGQHATPCIVVAGQVKAGRREMGALGVESAYAVTETAGSRQESMARPADHLERLSAQVARTWSH